MEKWDEKMFSRKIVIKLFETDATGVLYFVQQLRLAQETLECYLDASDMPLGKWLQEGNYFLPIVHVEADFHQPLRVGDEIEIRLSLERFGNSSFTLSTVFLLPGEILAGKASIVHVVIDRATWQSCPIPPLLIELLSGLHSAGSILDKK